MQLKKQLKTILPYIIILLIAVNIYFAINRTYDVIDYTDTIEYTQDDSLSNIQTEINNFNKFSYISNDDISEISYSSFKSRIVSSETQLSSNTTQDNLIFDKLFIRSNSNLSNYTNKSIVLPLKYSKFFDYQIYGQTEPDLWAIWDFDKLKSEFQHFYIDIAGYTNEYFILPGPLTKLDLIERIIGYLKENGIQPEQISLVIDTRVYVWEDRFFEDNIQMNYPDIVQQAEILAELEFRSKYPSIPLIPGTTVEYSNPENHSHIALSLSLELGDIINIAKKLGLAGYVIQNG